MVAILPRLPSLFVPHKARKKACEVKMGKTAKQLKWISVPPQFRGGS
jgi:hypothetical protein